ncbi:MAG: serine protease [Caldilineaceae bacterium]|nr:serine protease [Caldilineaceae bacterium]
MSLNDKFNQMTTRIEVRAPGGRSSTGSGFFYSSLAPSEGTGPRWRKIEEMLVVTNRHVLLPRFNSKEFAPQNVSLYLRGINKSTNQLKWIEVSLDSRQLEEKARFHPNDDVDVALIDIQSELSALVEQETLTSPHLFNAQSQAGNNNISVEVGSDVLVAGYPRGFYDDVNLFPIVKAGIIASRWGAPFQGNPYFLIDAKLFPGSSGSVVVSKPIDIVIKEGQIMYSEEKQFALLGIFSGEPFLREEPVQIGDLTITKESGFDLGIVWYAYTIEEARINGVSVSGALRR